ncbi:hypothetical protein [Aidingimonas halophila]|uniref:DUF2214 domain-containing protein n=1 Tax=Aidingimonas halophila TaxID=574349 RepID=A0A1H3FVY1_9GAMM|nr:hypothetical protein [Aidingimonas halophila]GHC39188.1 membrane protein [Aidingimonas halophila]SDX94985.1 hypothetical protein SAMN05443545_108158 [Aidingimonas halophila]
MTGLLELLAQTTLAEWIRLSRWGYAIVNTLHVLGIALLVGAIVPLDLRLMGWRRGIEPHELAGLLQPIAIIGLVVAMAMGGLLFLADPVDYAAMPLFQLKLVCIGLALINALVLNLGPGLTGASAAFLARAGTASLLLWLATLGAGRFLAFVQ